MAERVYIDAELAKDAICGCYITDDEKLMLIRRINRIPAADVVEVRHGKWIVKGDAQPVSNDKVYGCSLCDDKNRRYYEWQLSNYCPNCGVKMD